MDVSAQRQCCELVRRSRRKRRPCIYRAVLHLMILRTELLPNPFSTSSLLRCSCPPRLFDSGEKYRHE
ncbi:hypothetical protein SeMB42_g07201 [Synchytrium endobioticum]|uniref:Uncharacterized protein n=1 Tax=Synchytrium endobioticum TaxID=286115 RepID=A0A507C6F0_9FUNG|nr:hypothetical protein SeMB42_g07201 [Synchytrium endobioticum]